MQNGFSMECLVNGTDASLLPDLPEDIVVESDLLDDIINVIGRDIQQEMPPVTQRPYVEITEQPHPKALRFRYECEGRSAGSIPGVNTTADQKTYPSIQVHGYRGRAVVVVSCVTKGETSDGKEEAKYKPHPHNLVGKEGCKKGVCTVEINSTTMSYTFNNLGIQCVKKKDVEEALRLRQEIRVDPFRTGFAHAKEPGGIDLNAVRLCFQVFLEGQQRGRFTEPLTPVVSDIIYDKKAMSDLIICRLSDCSAPVSGHKEIILLCEKVVKEDIKVRFFEKKGNAIVWENYGEFSHTDVHKQVAISFRTPPYKTLDVTEPVKAYVQLERPSDNTYSEARTFLFTPLDSELRRKRQKLGGASAFLPSSVQQVPMQVPIQVPIPRQLQLDAPSGQAAGSSAPRAMHYNHGNANAFQQMPKEEIKHEPEDPTNQYQLQPVQALLNPQRTSPAPDRSPSTLPTSTIMLGAISPHADAGSLTPTPPYTNLPGTIPYPIPNLGNFGNPSGTTPQQQQQQQPTNFDAILPGPSNGWQVPLQVQPVPSQAQTSGTGSYQPLQSFNVGNFGSFTLPSDPMLGLGSLLSGTMNSQSNVGPPSLGSDLMNIDFTNLDRDFNSAELRSVLGNLSTTDLNRLEQIAGQAANSQSAGNLQQQPATPNQQQALIALLANQQHQQQQQQQQQQGLVLPDRNNDNDEDLTDSFTKLSTNDVK